MSAPIIAVVGGGLAGMAAALEAADAGAEVVIFERRPVLGGLTASIRHNGLSFDNGQHVFLRCCTAYRDFVDRIGATGQVFLQDRLDVPVLAPDRSRSSIKRSALPAPLHMARSLARYRHLSLGERARLLRPAMTLRRLDPDDASLDGISFGDWLAARGQGARAIDRLWNLIALPTLNVAAGEASLALATKVFRVGLLDRSDAGDIGWSRVPLGELHGAIAARALESAGVETVLGGPVVSIGRSPLGAFTVSAAARSVVVDAVILATPLRVSSSLASQVGSTAGADAERLGISPIVNVHLVLDRKVTDLPFAACVDSPVQFVFDRTVASGAKSGQCLAISLSAADSYISTGSAELVRMFLEAFRAVSCCGSGAPRRRGRHPREGRDVPGGPGHQGVPPSDDDRGAGLVSRWRVVRHRVAGDDGGRGPQRPSGCFASSGPPCGHRLGGPTTAGRGRDMTAISSPARGDSALLAAESLARARSVVTPAMEAAVLRLCPALRPAVREHLAGGGKFVRAGITLVSAAAVGADAGAGVVGAVAIEMVHNFSLVHDDIIDGDLERRHRPTLWAEHGVGHAIIAGDALVTLAFQILLEEPTAERVRAAARLAEATQAMIAGQAEDMASELLDSLSVEECLHMEAGKTGALLSCAASMGALLAGAPAPTVDTLADFGRHLGIAFQAVDDVLGIWGEPSVTGKPVGNDLRQHKKSLPVAIALARGTDLPAGLGCLHERELSEAEVAKATLALEQCGARQETLAIGEVQLQAALESLGRVPLAIGPRTELAAIARFVTERDR